MYVTLADITSYKNVAHARMLAIKVVFIPLRGSRERTRGQRAHNPGWRELSNYLQYRIKPTFMPHELHDGVVILDVEGFALPGKASVE